MHSLVSPTARGWAAKQGARGKPCSVAVTEVISFCFAPGHEVNPAVREGGTLLMCCVPLSSTSQSLHSRRAWRLTGSTQGPGGLFQWLLKKAGGGLDEGEQMVWGGCSYTRLKNSSLPCTSLTQAAQSTWQTTHTQFFCVFLIFSVHSMRHSFILLRYIATTIYSTWVPPTWRAKVKSLESNDHLLFALVSLLSLHGSAEQMCAGAPRVGREGRGGRPPLTWLCCGRDVRAQALH